MLLYHLLSINALRIDDTLGLVRIDFISITHADFLNFERKSFGILQN